MSNQITPVCLVFGTRPEAIKMAPVYYALKKEKIDCRVIVTGQHREMLDQVLELFQIKPDEDLNLMQKNQTLEELSSRLMEGLSKAFTKHTPSLVLVHGDTSTTFFASLCAFYKKIPVAHVEAGLRTENLYSPWPEEANRQLTARLSTWHYAPTELARENLLKEGITNEKILITGNTVIDALLDIKNRLAQDFSLKASVIEKLQTIMDLKILEKKLVLITGHRRENFGKGFENLCEAILELSLLFPDHHFLYPVHLNPNVRNVVEKMLGNTRNITLCAPLEYLEFVHVMSCARLIITDSGGIQEEAPSLSIPVLVTRDTTERPEALNAGTVRLVGTDKNRIVLETKSLLSDESEYKKMQKAINPYGDGLASQRIAKHIYHLAGSLQET